MRFSLDISTAAFAPGTITPTTGTFEYFCTTSSATDETVLHATTIILTLCLTKKFVSCAAYSRIIWGDLGP